VGRSKARREKDRKEKAARKAIADEALKKLRKRKREGKDG
jgi:hypothetical protein